jgi:3-methyladenine DNA glycosylase Mpg
VIRRGDAVPASNVTITPRIGISQCADWPLRWLVSDSAFVSKTPATLPRLSAPK